MVADFHHPFRPAFHHPFRPAFRHSFRPPAPAPMSQAC
jgi:hypothetical protein